MRKLLLVGVVLVVLLLAGEPTVRAGKPCSAPQSWGPVRGVVSAGTTALLVFEAADGTVRIIDMRCGSSPAKVEFTIERN